MDARKAVSKPSSGSLVYYYDILAMLLIYVLWLAAVILLF